MFSKPYIEGFKVKAEMEEGCQVRRACHEANAKADVGKGCSCSEMQFWEIWFWEIRFR